MKSMHQSEIVVSLVLVGLLLYFLRPTQLLMPMSVEVTVILFFVVAFLIFSALVWKESFSDERENLHRLMAGRISFIAGTAVLAFGIIVQSMSHDIDAWLVYTLIVMILAKSASRIYSQVKQ
jgi:hypothetical protein